MVRQVTLKDVAALAGVSYQTVSKVVNHQAQVTNQTEERIWKAVDKLGYHPNHIARSLRSQRSGMIGFSWEYTPPNQANPIHNQFLASVVQLLESSDYHILAFPFHRGKELTDSYRELVETNRVDGFIVSGIECDDPRIIYLQEQNVPFVAFGRSNPDWDFPFVDVDNILGMHLVTEHLIERGHRQFAVLAWPEASRVGRERLDGILEIVTKYGIDVPEGNIARGTDNAQFGYQQTLQWLGGPKLDRPTAIIALSDTMAVGAMNAIHDYGLWTGVDVAVTGYDDTPFMQSFIPSLTSVRQPIWEVGSKITEILLSVLDNTPLENTHSLLQPELIIRESSSQRVPAFGKKGHINESLVE